MLLYVTDLGCPGMYEMCVYSWSAEEANKFSRIQIAFWRKLLLVGGRAPKVIMEIMMHADSMALQWRVARVSLRLQLVNSPAGSWQQVALLTVKALSTD